MITFERYDATDLFLLDSASPIGGGFFAFYELSGTAGQTLSIAQTWSDTVGYYLFLREQPTDLSAFAASLAEYFAAAVPVHTGWAWLLFDSGQSGAAAITGTLIDAIADGESIVVAQEVSLRLHGYNAPLKQGAPVQAIAVEADNIAEFRFAYPPVPSSPAPNFASDLRIPLLGAQRGCLMGETTISDFSNTAQTGWNIGIYYFVQGAAGIVSQYYPVFVPLPGVQVMFQMSLDPVDQFNPDRTYLQFTDVAFRLVENPDAPSQFSIESVGASGILRSSFRTIYGEHITLQPVTNTSNGGRPAKLVLQPLPPEHGAEAYFTPDGDFRMVVDAAQTNRDQHELMLGLSGLESVRFRAGNTVGEDNGVLSFFASQAAYIPAFPLLGVVAESEQPLLTREYLTAWITLRPPLQSGTVFDTVYYAQPDGAPLYGETELSKAIQPGSADMLAYFPAAAAVLPQPSAATCFPAAPIATATPATNEFGAGLLRNLELQILSPCRRATIQQFITAPETLALLRNSSAVQYGATPQGLLVQTEGFQWKKLLLARNTDSSTGAVQELSFTDLNSTLQAAFQTNQQFLVITSDTYLKEAGTLFSNTISIEGWPFFLDVGLNGPGLDYRNILIFKFGEGTVAERVRDVRLWTDPADFNRTDDDNLQKLSAWLTNYIESAKERARHDSAFAHFAALVDNPAWNGILALNATIGLSEFPPELKGLLAGIDTARFSAHHFGIDVNFVQSDGVSLHMAAQSSMFGLIDYVDESVSAEGFAGTRRAALRAQAQQRSVSVPQNDEPTQGALAEVREFPPYYETPYEFVVLTLQVLFSNSEIRNFSSTIRLNVNQLFGEAVRNPTDATGPEVNAIILDGMYEDHSGSRSYVFNIRETVRYNLVGRVVDYVEISKAQFSTLQSLPVPGSDTDEIVQSKFSFWGTMRFFSVAEDFDIFSFERLVFAGMAVDMSFALSDSAHPAFAFNPGGMTFDMAGSEARDGSVFKNFPLQLQGMAFNGNSTGRPQDMGFMRVKTPLTNYSTAIDNTWNALSFTLNLGTPGALAEAIGFTAQLFAAWSPVYSPANNNPIDVSLKLPRGGGNKNQLSLQGVLQLTIRSLKFNTTLDDEGNRAFLLLLERVALRVLGMGLPSNATLDAVLFGNPEPGQSARNLGWYFAYNRMGV